MVRLRVYYSEICFQQRVGQQLIEIRDLLTVYCAVRTPGTQKETGRQKSTGTRSRRPERLVGRPDMFLIPTHRA